LKMSMHSPVYKMKPLIFLFLLWCLNFLPQCRRNDFKNDPLILARVNDQSITREQYITRFQDVIHRTGLTDNLESRRQVLKGMIDEDLLIIEARNRGWDVNSAGRQEYERVQIQELLNAFNRKFIQSKISVTEDELQKLYVNLNTKIKARHLYAPSKQKADSLYDLLQHGTSFQKLADENFNDPVLRESGGDLGYFSVDEMDPAFEEAAFNLAVGETSKPVRTNVGYSIIRVDDRRVKPIITQTEYVRKRPYLKAYWIKRKTMKATQKYVDSLRQSIKISFNEDLLKVLCNLLQENKNQGTIEQQNPVVSSNLDRLNKEVILSSEVGNWNVQMFREQAKFTSPTQQDWIRSEDNLKDFIAGLLVRSYILKKAREAGLDKTADYQKRVVGEFNNYLLDTMENHIIQDMDIPQDSLLTYYKEDSRRFAVPAKVYLREIVLNNKKDAGFIANKLKQGLNFADLAKRYSVRRRSGVDGGALGYLTTEDLGQWSGQVFALQPNEWGGPFQSDSTYFFLQCVEKKPAEPRSFESAKDDVRKTIQTLWQERERSRILAEIRSRVKVLAYSEKLENFRIN
jgi:parvulin-like peptidyl-prolyl isomerase